MMKQIFLILILTVTTIFQVNAQKNTTADKNKIIKEQAGRPDVPGDLFMEIGFSFLQGNEEWKSKFWGSKMFNVYYQYSYNIGDSKFSLHPGIGIGTDKFAMDTSTLAYGTDDLGDRIVETIKLEDAFTDANAFRKSKITTTYLDIPLELRFRTLKYDPKKSLKISVGGKIGFLLDSKTKVKYEANGEKKITKQNERFGLNKIRYSAFGKLGYGNAYLFFNYNFNSLFEKNQGPNSTDMSPMTAGFALSLF